MNTFAKLNNAWYVKSPDCGAAIQPGTTVPVVLRNGSVKQVTIADSFVRGDYRYYSTARPAPRPTETVGDLSAIVAVFATARRHLRAPSIVLDGFRVSVAGERSRNPGTLKVTSIDADSVSRFGGMTRKWFGSVSLAGVFQPGQNAPAGLAEKLRAFSADPSGEAARHGRLTGRCCFCNRRLGEGFDRRSVEVGYGPDCADHFGLPWGTRAAPAPAFEAVACDDDERNRARADAAEAALDAA